MLTGYASIRELAQEFGLTYEATSIAVSDMTYIQRQHGKAYATQEAARACVAHCVRRAHEAELRAAHHKGIHGHGGGYAQKRAEMWRERAERIRREYLAEAST